MTGFVSSLRPLSIRQGPFSVWAGRAPATAWPGGILASWRGSTNVMGQKTVTLRKTAELAFERWAKTPQYPRQQVERNDEL